jgi:hypothetical protein
MVNLFACVQPHRGGGAQTTVVNLERLLEASEPDHLRTWEQGAYRYRTSARLGHTIHPLRILRWVEGLPFFRYRTEYTLADDEQAREALETLDRLVRDPLNTFAFPLKPDEILAVWNGAPHGRHPQLGPTPSEPDRRRLLLRCRVQPKDGWAPLFASG